MHKIRPPKMIPFIQLWRKRQQPLPNDSCNTNAPRLGNCMYAAHTLMQANNTRSWHQLLKISHELSEKKQSFHWGCLIPTSLKELLRTSAVDSADPALLLAPGISTERLLPPSSPERNEERSNAVELSGHFCCEIFSWDKISPNWA